MGGYVAGLIASALLKTAAVNPIAGVATVTIVAVKENSTTDGDKDDSDTPTTHQTKENGNHGNDKQ